MGKTINRLMASWAQPFYNTFSKKIGRNLYLITKRFDGFHLYEQGVHINTMDSIDDAKKIAIQRGTKTYISGD